jgi:hypothetical protein
MQETDTSLTTQQIIDSFEDLPESEKQKVAYEILRSTVHLEVPSLTDEESVVAAEDLFLTLDAREAESGAAEPGRGLVRRSWAGGEGTSLPCAQRPV